MSLTDGLINWFFLNLTKCYHKFIVIIFLPSNLNEVIGSKSFCPEFPNTLYSFTSGWFTVITHLYHITYVIDIAHICMKCFASCFLMHTAKKWNRILNRIYVFRRQTRTVASHMIRWLPRVFVCEISDWCIYSEL